MRATTRHAAFASCGSAQTSSGLVPSVGVMKHRMALTGETSDHKVVGLIADETAAHELAEAVRAGAGLQEAQVRLLSPGDDRIGRTLEPENRGIVRTMIRAHIWLGLAGAIVGLLAFGIMIALGVQFIALNPWWSAFLLIGFGTIGGLMLGGAVSLRPDHSPYIAASREALRQGRYVVVVHATSSDELEQAEAILKANADDTVRTL